MQVEDDFWVAYQKHGATQERVDALRELAAAFRTRKCYLSAGIASAQIIHAGWGLLNRESRLQSVIDAISDFQKCVETSNNNSLEAIIALKLWSQELVDWKLEQEGSELSRARQKICAELAERLKFFAKDERSGWSYLVFGVSVSGSVTGPWTAEFPDAEIDDTVTTWKHDRTFCFRIPSAFQLFVRIGDYEAAWKICKANMAAFCTPALRGWR